MNLENVPNLTSHSLNFSTRWNNLQIQIKKYIIPIKIKEINQNLNTVVNMKLNIDKLYYYYYLFKTRQHL